MDPEFICQEYLEDPAICDDMGEPKGQCANCGDKWYNHSISDTPEADLWRNNFDDSIEVISAYQKIQNLERERNALKDKLSGKIEMGTVCIASKQYIDELLSEIERLKIESKQGSDVALQMTVRLHEVADERDLLRDLVKNLKKQLDLSEN
jgi:hypothetical protein